MDETQLKSSMMKILDKSSEEIDNLIVNMDFKDLVNITKAIKQNDNDTVIKISHGYSI